MKKVGGEERKEKLFFPHFFLPSFVNIKRHRTTRKKSQHSSEIQTSTLKKFYSINILVEVSIVRSPAIQPWLIDSNFGKTFAIINLKLNTQKKKY